MGSDQATSSRRQSPGSGADDLRHDLVEENARLRELVIHLSKLVIQNVMDQDKKST